MVIIMRVALKFSPGILSFIWFIIWHGTATAECTQPQIFALMDKGLSRTQIEKECDRISDQSNTDRGIPPMRSNCRAKLDWGNIVKYFNIHSYGCEQGFEHADSVLTVVVQAKGYFSGSLGASFYNSNGNLICPRYPDTLNAPVCNVLGYRADFDNSSWKTQDNKSVIIRMPYNSATVNLDFRQNR